MEGRKRRILQAVTDDYIVTAEPVGSRTLARKYNLGVSPATIRNDMADLEDAGYLEQPHTSAGRIPSDQGYRYYVDALMTPEEPEESARDLVRREITARHRALEEAIHHAAHLLAMLTPYTSLAVAPRTVEGSFRHIEFIALENRNVLVVCVIDPGFVESRIVELERSISPKELTRLSGLLNGILQGFRPTDIGATAVAELRGCVGEPRLYEVALELIQSGLGATDNERVYLDGTMNLFNQPEFRDIDRARAILGALEQRDLLLDALSEATSQSGWSAIIGHENPREAMRGCSIVSAAYHVGGKVVGTIGVVGPTRMDYGRVVAVVEFVAQALSESLSNRGR